MDTLNQLSRLARPKIKQPVILSADPEGVWEDPLHLLEVDPQRAYLEIEDLLISLRRVTFWSSYIQAIRSSSEGISNDSEKLPAKIIEIIETEGFVPSAEQQKISHDEIHALLVNPDALLDAHLRIWASDSPYWEERLAAPKVVEPKPVPQPIPIHSPWSYSFQKLLAPAAVLLLMTAGGAFGLYQYNELWRQLEDAHQKLQLNEPVEFATGDQSNPLFGVGHQVGLKGKVKSHLIREIQITIEPGLGGNEVSQKKVSIPGDPDKETPPVNFHEVFVMPKDGKLRRFTIQFVPHDKPAKYLHAAELSYKKIPVACLPSGVVINAQAEQGPSITSIEMLENRQEVIVTIEARSYHGSFVTIAHATRGGKITYVQPARFVSAIGETKTFAVFLGADEEYEVTAFAADDRESLAPNKIIEGNLQGVLVGESKIIRPQSKK